jgi:hypothetical protein
VRGCDAYAIGAAPRSCEALTCQVATPATAIRPRARREGPREDEIQEFAAKDAARSEDQSVEEALGCGYQPTLEVLLSSFWRPSPSPATCTSF